jgi:hypothetical protein
MVKRGCRCAPGGASFPFAHGGHARIVIHQYLYPKAFLQHFSQWEVLPAWDIGCQNDLFCTTSIEPGAAAAIPTTWRSLGQFFSMT